MGEVTLTDVKYLSPVGVSDPLSLSFWADYVDPDFLRELSPIFGAVAVFCAIWFFVMPYVHRSLEKRVQDKYSRGDYPGYPFCVAELGLVWPVIGMIGICLAFVFAITANSRICMLCASSPENVRGFGGGFCAYTTELADSLRIDNTTNCIFVKESLLGPGRRTWMRMSSSEQLSVLSEHIERKFTGTKGVHTLRIASSNNSDSEVVTLLRLEQNSTEPLTPFNETVNALKVFAESEPDPVDFAGSLGWGYGKLYLRASRETVQLIVFRQDEMVCALLGAIGIAILISVPLMETCEFQFTRYSLKVCRERYFAAPMSWVKKPTLLTLLVCDTRLGVWADGPHQHWFGHFGHHQICDVKFPHSIRSSGLVQAYFEAKKRASKGILCLKVNASRSGRTTMDCQLRELSVKDGAEEALRIQRFLYKCGFNIELTDEERTSCEDITPPPLPEEKEEVPVEDKKQLRRRQKA